MGNSDAVEVGDLALAIGDPFGVGQTVTQGIISALARTNVGGGGNVSSFYLQTDASINPGNSGGALIDTHARLVGINSAIFSQSGGSVGIGFAIPVDMVRIVVAAAKAGDKLVHRPWLGASLQPVTYDIAETFGLNRPIGALVTEVASNGPAAEAGVKQGDLITAIDGKIIESPESFGFRFGTKPIAAAHDALPASRHQDGAGQAEADPRAGPAEAGQGGAEGPVAVRRPHGGQHVAGGRRGIVDRRGS